MIELYDLKMSSGLIACKINCSTHVHITREPFSAAFKCLLALLDDCDARPVERQSKSSLRPFSGA